MEIVSNLSGHWLEIAVAVYLIGMILYGHYRGFIRLAVSLTALIITLAAAHIAMPYATNWLKNDTPVYEALKQGMEKAAGLDRIMDDAPDEESQMATEKAAERAMIEKLDLPEQLKRMLVENNNHEVYEMIGVELFHDYISGYLADLVLRIVVFVAVFLVVFILLHVVVVWLDLIAKLPILSGLNQIAGAILGGVEAMIFIWIGCLIFTALSGTGIGSAIMRQVDASSWLSWIYDHNMLSWLVIGLISSVL